MLHFYFTRRVQDRVGATGDGAPSPWSVWSPVTAGLDGAAPHGADALGDPAGAIVSVAPGASSISLMTPPSGKRLTGWGGVPPRRLINEGF
jgi:hypothetical protein